MPEHSPDEFSTRSAGKGDAAGGTPPIAAEAPLIRAAREGAEAATPGSHDRPRNAPHIDGYEFVRELHRGGQGVVYQALEKATKRKVAIKVLLEGPYASDHARRRFEREIELAASLKHPNIVPVFHSGMTPDGRQFCVMDYVRGVPLHQYVRDQKLGLEDSLKLFAKVCEAVNYAHQKGIIHRDLKPSNILVDSDGSPKVLDFGLAKLVGGPEQTLISMTGQVVGTLPYLSPEQARGNPDEIDIRTDVYSLGVVLYEILTGQFPYPVIGQMTDVLRHIASTEPTPPSKTWKPDSGVTQRTGGRQSKLGSCPIDDEVQTIVLRALTKERQRRYQSAAELGKDVEHYLFHEPIEAKKDSALYVLRKQLRRYRAPVAIIVSFVFLLLGVAIVMSVMARRNATLAAKERIAKEEATTARNDARTAAAAERSAKELAQRQSIEIAKARDAALLDSYKARLAAADSSELANEPARIRVNLDACPRELRGWEWCWYNARTDNSIATARATHYVRTAAFTDLGPRIASLGPDSTVIILDPALNIQISTLRGHEAFVNSVEFSKSGERVVTASADGTARVWNVNTGQEIGVYQYGPNTVLVSATFSPHCNYILTRTSSAIPPRVWSVADPYQWIELVGLKDFVQSATFSPSGDRILTVSKGNSARVWDPSCGMELLVLSGGDTHLYWGQFSSDGRQIVTWGANDLTLWDASTGRRLHDLKGHTDLVSDTMFTRDGEKLITTSSDKTGRIWSTDSGEQLTILRGHSGRVVSADVSPDGARIATSSEDGSARIWDAETGNELGVFRGHLVRVDDVEFNADATLLMTRSNDMTVRLWDALMPDSSGVLSAHEAGVLSGSFSENGNSVVTASLDTTARVWDSYSRRVLMTLKGHKERVTGAIFAGNDNCVVTASWDKSVRVWQNGTETAVLPGHKDHVNSLTLSSDGSRIVTASSDGKVRVFDSTTRSETAKFSVARWGVLAASLSPDGNRFIVGCWDPIAQICNYQDGQPLFVLHGHKDAIGTAIFNPIGDVALTTSWDHTARLWNTSTGEQIGELRGTEITGRYNDRETPPFSQYEPSSAVFSPDGRRVVTALGDHFVRVWDVESRVELALLRWHSNEVTSVTFSSDGTRLLTSSMDKTARIWDSVPYRIRYAEQLTGKQGKNTSNLGLQYVKEVRGESPATWLSDPAIDNGRPVVIPVVPPSTSEVASSIDNAARSEAERLVWNAIEKGDSSTLVIARQIREDRSLTDEVRAYAREIVFELSAGPGAQLRKLKRRYMTKPRVLQAAQADDTMRPRIKADVIQQIQAWVPTPNELNEVAWDAVSRPTREIESVGIAIEVAEEASRMQPNDGLIANTLGVALFRGGRYDDCLLVLAKSIELNKKANQPQPCDFAVTAMAQARLGRGAEAAASMVQLRALMRNPIHSLNAESLRFLREAELEVEGKITTTQRFVDYQKIDPVFPSRMPPTSKQSSD